MYISDKSNYNKNVEIIENKLTTSIPKVNELFKQYDFIQLLYEFKKYANIDYYMVMIMQNNYSSI